MATPTHVVLRPFDGPEGRIMNQGERVRAEDWRNVRALESQRYLRPLLAADLLADAEKKAAGKGKV